MLSGISYPSLAETCLGRSFPEEVRNVGHITRNANLSCVHEALTSEGRLPKFYPFPARPWLGVARSASVHAIAVCAVIFRSFNFDFNRVEIVEPLASVTGEPRSDFKKSAHNQLPPIATKKRPINATCP